MQQRFLEIKELLQLFGIPYIESPGEAEAQCAFLEQQHLVDATITEDSDIFLFGGKRVIRRLFDKGGAFQEYYESATIEKELGLSREQLIHMALFLGCDYTPGIHGVGIVNAIEITNAFNSVEGLARFKVWADNPDLMLQEAD